jgi:hypothetical protein
MIYDNPEVVYLKALNIINEALGNRFEHMNESCIEMANLAAQHIKHSLKAIENEK